MGLETGTYISSLNSSNPTTGDNKTEGDDHIRLIKATLLATFPSITGAVSKTHTELNNALSSSSWAMSSDRLLNSGNTQPAFLATGSITLGTPVIYSTEVFDRGSCYDNTTGVFTAPVAGVYHFSAGLGNTSLTTGVEFSASISKNGTGIINFTTYKHGSTAAGGNASLTLVLAASDTVRVDCSTGPSTSSTTWNYFCGHLLY
jgi:C1q domain